jgi:SNF2 family DNA or RNA helicase
VYNSITKNQEEKKMELNRLKIELIRKLLDAKLSKDEQKDVLKKAKEIISKDKLSKS